MKELTDWYSFGRVVGESKAQLIAIERDGRTTKERRRFMLERWMKSEQPTWSRVVSSLFKCGRSVLGQRLALKYSKNTV